MAHSVAIFYEATESTMKWFIDENEKDTNGAEHGLHG